MKIIENQMKVKILKSFWLDNVEYSKGDIAEVSTNVAHGLFEQGKAVGILQFSNIKEMENPQRDKMISKKRGRKKVITK